MTVLWATAFIAPLSGRAAAAGGLVGGVALTPYMGVNTWYSVGDQVNEGVVTGIANSVSASGLESAGYNVVWIDGGWWQGARDPAGNIVVDPNQWPHGMAWIASYLHARGLKAGIYTDAGSDGCVGPHQGSYGRYQQDVNTFAAWGFDLVKVDFCGGRRLGLDPRSAFRSFVAAITADSPHRRMLLNICNGYFADRFGTDNPPYERSAYGSWAFAPAIAGSWRTAGDIGNPGDVTFGGVLQNLDYDALHPYAAGPGHWNDPDYLVPDEGMTPAEAQAQFSMWTIVAAPLVLGDDVRTMPPLTRAMVTNPEAIAIDQDRLGIQGWVAAQSGSMSAWVRPLAGGARAVAFLNRGTAPATMSVSAMTLGLTPASRYQVQDVWAHTTTRSGSAFTRTVPGASAILLRVTAITPPPKPKPKPTTPSKHG